MNKHFWIIVIAVGVSLVLILITPRPDAPDPSKQIDPDAWNVLIIQADTLRADRLGAYGHTRAKTPNLDALAAEGVLFEQHIVNATYTACSIPSLLTGNYQDRHGLWFHGDTLSEKNLTLPERLSALGYRTAGFSANPIVHEDRGYAQGIDSMRTLKQNNNAEQMVDHATNWLDKNGDDPFFLWLLLIDPHFPYTPPDRFTSLYPESGTYEESLSWQWEFNQSEAEWDKESLMWGYVANEQQIAQESALYDGEIAYLDEQVGRLLDYLDENGLRDNTLIVFTSDHGEELAEHTLFCTHGNSTYETLARVPLIIQTPDSTTSRVPQVVRTIDIAPTILSLLDIPYEDEMDGRSLAPLVRGTETALPKLPAYIANGPIHEGFWKENPRMYVKGVQGTWATVRTEEWKLIRIPHPEKYIFELYNIKTDPEEKHNLYNSNPDQAAALITILDSIKTRLPDGSLVTPQQQELDEETRQTLESLGYLSE